jgi:predicted HTH transcriptional regulator
MNPATLTRVEGSETESADLDFKSEFNSGVPHDWCEFVKDLVAMANSGGGLIVFGVNDDGSPAAGDLTDIGSLDHAVIVDKVTKYTGQNFAAFSLERSSRGGRPVVIVEILPTCVPIVFTAPGTYDIGGGKQKRAFGQGTVYFRHGAKSEPGTSDDLRVALALLW